MRETKITHGLASELFRTKTGLKEEANIDSSVNPFKKKTKMQDLLIQREKERYMKAAKRDLQLKQLTAVDEGPVARRNLSLQQTSSGLIDRTVGRKGNQSLAVIPVPPSTLKKAPKREGMLRLVSKIGANDAEILDEEKRQRLLVLKKAARRINRGEFS